MYLIEKYFTDLSERQRERFRLLEDIYSRWNQKINVISRRDMVNFYERHVLHSLAIGRFLRFTDGSRILDIGTGGGFPGLPLAILFENSRFYLADSVSRKITVVKAVIDELDLKNTVPLHIRAEDTDQQFDFALSRATVSAEKLLKWTRGKFLPVDRNPLPNGLICLKGGDLSEQMQTADPEADIFEISSFFQEDFFRTKKIVYIPASRP